MTQVRIPPVLRESAAGEKQVELEGATVGEVLEGLVERFPGLRAQLFTGEGELNRFVNVYLNDEDVRYLSALETPTNERDTIVVLPAMAGGGGHPGAEQRNPGAERRDPGAEQRNPGAQRRDPGAEQRNLAADSSDSCGRGVRRSSPRPQAVPTPFLSVPKRSRRSRGLIFGADSAVVLA